MDPHYRPFFAHVMAICWPWLWWNLRRLTAWRLRTGREVFVAVDRYGNVHVRYVGDAPQPDGLYTYEAPDVLPWERLAPGFALPEAPPDMPGCLRAFSPPLRASSGHLSGHPQQVRGPP